MSEVIEKRLAILKENEAVLRETSQNFQSAGFSENRDGYPVIRTAIIQGRNVDHRITVKGEATEAKFKKSASIFSIDDDVVVLPIGDTSLLSVDQAGRLLGEKEMGKIKNALRTRLTDPINNIA